MVKLSGKFYITEGKTYVVERKAATFLGRRLLMVVEQIHGYVEREAPPPKILIRAGWNPP
jgi:hypothetical protein